MQLISLMYKTLIFLLIFCLAWSKTLQFFFYSQTNFFIIEFLKNICQHKIKI